jgi:hypothetical protein
MRGDDRLRALERRFRETGTTEDEAAWLRERVRTGGVGADRVVLAARLGHPAARHVATLDGDGDAGDLDRWVMALVLPGEVDGERAVVDTDFARQACGRVAIACAWLIGDLRRLWTRRGEREALRAAEAWALCPCPPHALQASIAAAAGGHDPLRPRLRINTLPIIAAELAGTENARHVALLAGSALKRAAGSLGRADQLLEFVRESVVPWALGDADPLRERRGEEPESGS